MQTTKLSFVLLIITTLVVFSGCTTQFDNKVGDPIFEPKEGNYVVEDGLEVIISSNTPDAIIYYTLNGLEPDDDANIYQGPIKLQKSSVVNAIAYVEGMLPSYISTAQYSLTLTKEFDECEETDNGLDYTKKGITKTSKESKEDECTAGANYNLIEYYCSKDLSLGKPILPDGFDCPNGCKDGACI